MNKVQMYAGAIKMLLYGLCVCTDDKSRNAQSATVYRCCTKNAVVWFVRVYMDDYPLANAHGLSSHTDAQPYNNLQLYTGRTQREYIVQSLV